MKTALHRWTVRAAAVALLGSLVPPALGLAGLLQPVPAVPGTAIPEGAPAIAAEPASDLGVILEAAPFGRLVPVATPDDPGSSGLVLVGVTVAASPGASRAMIAGGSRGASAIYGIGDSVAGGMTLAAVQPDGVTLDAAGQALHLGFPETAGAATGAETPPSGGLIDFSGIAVPSSGAQP
jgi:hypothetical protein